MTKFSASQQSQLAQIGAFLREHREKQSKSLEDIAIRTYIRPQLLSGIETGNPDLLPEPIFVQGFIRRYAETLGLQGTEISQQFTVTSIPSTPRPPRPTEVAESSTTRLTRRPSTPSANAGVPDNATSEPTAASDSMFSAGSLSPVGESLSNNSGDTSASPDTSSSEPASDPQDIPLVIDDAILAQSAAPVEAPSVEAPTDLGLGMSDESAEAPDSAPEIEIDFSSPDFSDDVPTFNPQALSTDSLETNLNPATLGQGNSMPAADASTTEFPQFDDGLPPTFTTQSPQATPETPLPTATRSPAYAPEPVGVELGSDTEGPNLKPFAIGAVVIAAITAGMVLLANVLSSDRAPNVVDSNDGSSDQSELVEPDTEILPELPTEPVVETPPASTAPVYVEATATAETYVSIEADGANIFEGTMQPGDELLWEAQESVDVYSGNAGGLSVAANGGPSEVLGESGQLGQKVFTVPQ